VRYIGIIVAFLVVVSSVFIYVYIYSPEKKIDAMITVNKRVISKDEFNHQLSRLYSRDRTELLNTIVVQELLLQEAQRMGIDKTDAFRRTIQDFYEHTLVKQAIDRKLSDTPIAIGDKDIDHYLAFQVQRLYLSFYTAESEDDAVKGKLKLQEKRNMLGKDLSEDMGIQIQKLKIGEKTAPVGAGSDWTVIQLEKVVGGSVSPLPAAAKEAIRKVLAEREKNRVIDSWVGDLRKKAVISNK